MKNLEIRGKRSEVGEVEVPVERDHRGSDEGGRRINSDSVTLDSLPAETFIEGLSGSSVEERDVSPQREFTEGLLKECGGDLASSVSLGH